MEQITLTKENSKYCRKCNTIKIKTDFANDKRRSNGLTSSCKDCLKIKRKNYYLKNKEKFQTYYHKYKKSDSEPEMDMEISI